MNIKPLLAQRLRKYPILYRLAAKIYGSLEPYQLLGLFIGTKAEEMRWAKRSIAEGYWGNRNHPSKVFLANRIATFFPFSNILEVGCASGPNLYVMAKRFPRAEITGVDINAAAVKYGNQQFAKEGISNVKLIAGKADELERFPDRSFDIVFTFALLTHVGPDKIEKILRDMVRISGKALVLMERYSFESSRDVNRKGICDGGIWIRDYAALLKQFVPEEQIHVNKVPEAACLEEPWKSSGTIIEVSLSGGI